MRKPIIRLGNIYSIIENLPSGYISKNSSDKKMTAWDCIKREISYEVPNLYYVQAARPGWDGIISLGSDSKKIPNGGKFLTGVFAKVVQAVYDITGMVPKVVDLRVKPEKNLDLDWDHSGFPLRPYQREVVSECIHKGRGLINVATGGGKCCNENTLIPTEQGILPIKYFGRKLTNPEDSGPINLKLKSENSIQDASFIYYDGITQSVSIETLMGYNIIATKKHRIKILNQNAEIEWRYMEDLSHGDIAVISRSEGMFGQDTKISKEDAYFLGLLYGSGDLDKDNAMTLTSGCSHIINFYQEYMSEKGFEFRTEQNSPNSIRIISKKDSRTFAKGLGAKKARNYEKEWPIPILKSKKEILSNFMTGLYETDGWVDKRGRICIALSNDQFIKDLQVIFLQYGIISSRRIKKTNNIPISILTISSEKSRKLFFENIPLDSNGYKYHSLKKSFNENVKDNIDIDVAYNVEELMRHCYEVLKNNLKKDERQDLCKNKFGISYNTIKSYFIGKSKRRPSIDICKKIFSYPMFGLENKTEIFDGRNLFVPINKIDIVESKNYDFSVPETRSYIGGGFVNHNTIMVSKIIQELGVAPFIFYVLTKDLMYQSKKRLEASIPGIKVGMVGDGNCDIQDVTIMTIMTATTVYDIDIIKELKGYSAWSDGESSLLSKEKMTHLAKKSEIKELIETSKALYFDECLSGDTKILDDNGIPIDIKDIKNGDNVIGGEVSRFFSRNVKQYKEVIHSCGKMHCTNKHMHIGVRREDLSKNKRIRKVKEKDVQSMITDTLSEGDFLLVPSFVPHSPKKDNGLTFNQMRFIAAIMGIGHIDKCGYRVKINVDKDRDWFRMVFREGLLDFGIKDYMDKEDSCGGLLLSVSDKELKNFLVNHVGIPKGQKSQSIYINKFLWNNSLEALGGFIDGIFGTEGYISNNIVNIYRSSLYGGFCDIQLLLLKFGILSFLESESESETESKNTKKIYKLIITGEDIENIKKLKISMSRKKESIDSIKIKKTNNRYVYYCGKKYYLSEINNINKVNNKLWVYDFTCESHKFIANNTLTHNCHHAAAKTCKNVITKSTNSYYLFGGTATPTREDNAEILLEGLFGRMRGNITASFLIQQGFLVAPDIYYIKLKNKERADSYAEDYRMNITENDERNGIIISLANYFSDINRPTLVLVKHIKHGKFLEKHIRNSFFVHGGTSKKKRVQCLEDFEKGKFPILIGSTIADEGLDLPNLSALIKCGGGKSQTRAKQRVGRVIRLDPSDPEKKPLVFDFMDVGKWISKHSRVRKKILQQEEEFRVHTINSLSEVEGLTAKGLF